MKSLLAFTLLVATAVSALNLTEDEREQARLALQNPGLFEGDVMGIDPHDRSVVPDKQKRWPNGIIPYVIDESLDGIKSLINSAMQDFHMNTCIRFVPRTTHRNYVKMVFGSGCYSYIGFINWGAQNVVLGKGCHFRGTIVHELGHAIGMFHEHSRSDRNLYLTIYWENIQQGMENQFLKLKPEQNLLLTAFDHNSIMMYGNYAFSENGKSVTMEAKNGQRLVEPFEKRGMTRTDIERINMMYECKKSGVRN